MEFFIIIDMMKAFLRTQNPKCHKGKEKILIGRNNIVCKYHLQINKKKTN